MLESYLIFKRWQFNLDEKMLFSLTIRNIDHTEKGFQSLIKLLFNESYKEKAFINVYKIVSIDGNLQLDKIAWIREGELFTL